jgi:hypothetical protein
VKTIARTRISGFMIEIESNGGTTSAARFSADQRYRYNLTRIWDGQQPALVVVGLNPSTADANIDDQTIRRCLGFAKREKLGGLVMLNLFALRSTDPKAMLRDEEPVGPENDVWIQHAVDVNRALGSTFVAGWGVHGSHLHRDEALRRLIPEMKCFGITKDGAPRHPLYLRGDAPIVTFPRRGRVA